MDGELESPCVDNSVWKFFFRDATASSDTIDMTILTCFFRELHVESLTDTVTNIHHPLLLSLSCMINKKSNKFESNLKVITLSTGTIALTITCAIIYSAS